MTEVFNLQMPFNLEDVNDTIARYEVPIAYEGIANKFEFSKEVLNGLIDTIRGARVRTVYNAKDDDFMGHEDDLVRTSSGYQRTPEPWVIGFCAYDIDAQWKDFTFDGVTRSYLTAIVYLWKEAFPYLQDLNDRKVYQSMEVEVDFLPPDANGIKKVIDAKFQAITLLGSQVKPAFNNSTFLKFSSENNLEQLKQEYEAFKSNEENSKNKSEETFISKDDLGSKSELKVDKSKDAVSDTSWGDIDKSILKKECLMASNYKTICPYVFMQLSHGWEDGKEGSLGYPVMEKKGDTLIYNRYGLADAKVFAEKNNDAEVLAKVNAIYKKIGLDNDNLKNKKEGEKMSKDFKAMYSKMKEEKSTFAFDDSDDAMALIDSDAGVIYILADGEVTKLPYCTTAEDDTDESFSIDEDKKEKMSSAMEMMSKIAAMSKVEKDKLIKEHDEKMTTKESEFSTKLQEKDKELEKKDEEMSAKEKDFNKKLEDKDAEIGKAFSKISSLETGLMDAQNAIKEKDDRIAEYAKILKGQEDEKKKAQMSELLNKKEFSVFSAEEKTELINQSTELSYDEFENKVYSTFGKRVKDSIKFSGEGQPSVSFMFTESKSTLPKEKTEEDDDIYSKIRKENKINN